MQTTFMSGSKNTGRLEPVTINWNTTKDIRAATEVLAAISGLTVGKFALAAIVRWANEDSIYSEKFDDFRTETLATHVSTSLKNQLDSLSNVPSIGRGASLTRSEIIHYCVKREIKQRLIAWGCLTPCEFIDLLRAEYPLQKLKKIIDEYNAADVETVSDPLSASIASAEELLASLREMQQMRQPIRYRTDRKAANDLHFTERAIA